MKVLRPLLFLLSAALPSLFSCSQADPELLSATLRLVYRQGGEERLSFFALADDDDGIVDLEELHLLNDGKELYWSLGSADWMKVEKPGETWIGSHAIGMNDGLPFPRGGYRAVVVDKGGARSERSLSLDAPLVPRFAFPLFTVSAGRYRLVSSYPAHRLIAYDASGASVRIVPLRSKEGAVAELGLPQSVVSLAVWAEDEEALVAAMTDPVKIE